MIFQNTVDNTISEMKYKNMYNFIIPKKDLTYLKKIAKEQPIQDINTSSYHTNEKVMDILNNLLNSVLSKTKLEKIRIVNFLNLKSSISFHNDCGFLDGYEFDKGVLFLTLDYSDYKCKYPDSITNPQFFADHEWHNLTYNSIIKFNARNIHCLLNETNLLGVTIFFSR